MGLSVQGEVRRALERVGRAGLRVVLQGDEHRHALDRVIRAAMRMARQGHGALLVVERETGLQDVIDTGIPLGAEIAVGPGHPVNTQPIGLGLNRGALECHRDTGQRLAARVGHTAFDKQGRFAAANGKQCEYHAKMFPAYLHSSSAYARNSRRISGETRPASSTAAAGDQPSSAAI